MLVSRTELWLNVCPSNVFNGPSSHSASLVRMMLITIQHLATLSCCSSHTLMHTHFHTDVHVHTHTHIRTQSDAQTQQQKPAKIHVSKQAKCKCNHKQISSHSTGHSRVFINTQAHTHITHTTHTKKQGHNTQHISALSPLSHCSPILLQLGASFSSCLCKHNLHYFFPLHLNSSFFFPDTLFAHFLHFPTMFSNI